MSCMFFSIVLLLENQRLRKSLVCRDPMDQQSNHGLHELQSQKVFQKRLQEIDE